MVRTLALLFFGLLSPLAARADVEAGYGLARSPFSISHRLQLAYAPNGTHKISLIGRRAKSQMTVDDPNTSSLRGVYRYHFASGAQLGVDLKLSDEAYFYKGGSMGLRALFPVLLSTRISLAGQVGRRTYSLKAGEVLQQSSMEIGVEQGLGDRVGVGISYESHGYQGDGSQTRLALQGGTPSNADVSSYTALLFGSSTTVFVDYVDESWSAGLSFAKDNYALVTGSILTWEVFGELSLTPHWSLSLFVARGTNDYNSTITDSLGAAVACTY